jgi:vacuolar-type H+-ATPase subunit H
MDILRMIDELQSLANTGTRVPGFRGKVMVDMDRLMALGEEFRASVPPSLQEAQEILKQRESIINQAYLEAQRIKTSAEQEAEVLTSSAHQEHMAKVDEAEVVKAAEAKASDFKEEAMLEAQQITQDAQRRAYRILNEAEGAASTRRDGSDHYAREVLFNLEEQLAEVLGQVRRGIDALRLEASAQPVENHVPA